MRRREFIAGLGGAATLPLAVRAQQRVPRIGVLLVSGSEILGEFPQGLRELGYVEGKSYRPAATPIVWPDSRWSWFAARWTSSSPPKCRLL